MFKKMVMFAASLASRGIKGTKTDIETKKLRVVSCFGTDQIKPCPYLKLSKNNINHYCTKCGCGDKKHTWLIKESEDYSKLDYPVLECPVKMPGFTNYDPNFYNEEIKERKEQIEAMEPEMLQYIQVSIGSNPQKEKIIEEVNKITNNS